MKNVFFFSDVHLGLHNQQQEKEKEARLLSFLSHVQQHGDQLFILGDLFDYWFEYHSVIPRGYHRVLTKLESLVASGISIRYLAGNHDFWLKDFFPNDLGIPVYKDPFGMTLYGKKFYFHHGDGLALNDAGYRILKSILRSRISIFLYSLLHPDWTAPIARGSSKTSRRYTGHKDYGETDGMIQFAEQKLSEGYDFVIMGHRHKPLRHPFQQGLYLNLGDWITHCTYAEFDGKKIELKAWKIGTTPTEKSPKAKKPDSGKIVKKKRRASSKS